MGSPGAVGRRGGGTRDATGCPYAVRYSAGYRLPIRSPPPHHYLLTTSAPPPRS
ncbi:hypothetical protein ACKI2C_17350 [Streptomyces brasiliscabiei]|uniref:hypothetical protein n=1 Tax=Streptomyces brasiliscabiei TaxID=2736302 RepID=UPI0038F6E88E